MSRNVRELDAQPTLNGDRARENQHRERRLCGAAVRMCFGVGSAARSLTSVEPPHSEDVYRTPHLLKVVSGRCCCR